ncbi:MAG: DNA adenine methylase [Pyrinomonadaceae bacterium]|nr:DNA adenine methylase [Pyrinomonadaceae bacterium]MBP6211687.1 DNA adenine methylase [Pyrinomonadaceae bacterium]
MPEIWDHIKDLPFETVYDAFAGSNVVSYFLKCKGKRVITNDFLTFSFVTSKAIIENASVKLGEKDLDRLLADNVNDGFIQNRFSNIFFDDTENAFLDKVRANIGTIKNEHKRALAHSALVRACIKKRSRGIFTFVGERYNDGRSDMRKTLLEHFVESVGIFNRAVFDNGKMNSAHNRRTEECTVSADLVYLDPPYFSPKSDNDYVRRYHFVEGLVKNWKDVELQDHTAVKKFKSYDSPFSRRTSTFDAFDKLFSKFENSIIVVSYSSNSFPTKEELLKLLGKYKSDVVCHEIDHTYSFGNQNHKIGNANNRVQEYLFIGR